MASLLLKGIYKVYPSGVTAVTDFNLDIKDKEFIVFVGPSGCGKSTTLRMIAGLEEISKGELYIDGKLVNDVVPKDRDIAMVFQNYALYPHMTVYDNMAFGLKLRKVPKQIIDERVKEAAAILGITDYLTRKPKALSGGQRQRVALGRAIVREPKVFLLDEPLSNLDAKLRAQMRTEISKLHARLATTFIYVTHDQIEAMTMGTRIVVMKDGFMQQVDTPQNLYDYPINQFVAGFIGTPQMNFFKATLTKDDKGKVYCEFINNNKILLPKSVVARIRNIEDYLNTEKPVTLGVRPEDIHEEEAFINASPDTVVKVLVEVVEKLGAETQIYCKLDYKEGEEVGNVIGDSASSMIAKIDSRSTVNRGEVIELAFDANHIHLFDATTEMSILARDDGYEITPENEVSSNFVPLTPQEMQAIIEKNRVVTKEEKAAMRREARAAARKEKAEAKAAAEAAAEIPAENATNQPEADAAPEIPAAAVMPTEEQPAETTAEAEKEAIEEKAAEAEAEKKAPAKKKTQGNKKQ